MACHGSMLSDDPEGMPAEKSPAGTSRDERRNQWDRILLPAAEKQKWVSSL
jgi:hypothetical protein